MDPYQQNPCEQQDPNGPSQYNRNPYSGPQYPDSISGLATASLALGIVGLITMIFGIGFAPAALGIILALLSRGKGKMSGMAVAGLVLSVIALVLTILILIYVAVLLLSGAMDAYLQEITAMMQEMGYTL